MNDEAKKLSDESLETVSGGQYDPTASMTPKVKSIIEATVKNCKTNNMSINDCIATLRGMWPTLEGYQKKGGLKYLQVGGSYLSEDDVDYYVTSLWFS